MMAKKDGYFTDKQHQATVSRNVLKREGKTNAAFDSQVKTKSASWPASNDRKTNEARVDVTNKSERKNKATVK